MRRHTLRKAAATSILATVLGVPGIAGAQAYVDTGTPGAGPLEGLQVGPAGPVGQVQPMEGASGTASADRIREVAPVPPGPDRSSAGMSATAAMEFVVDSARDSTDAAIGDGRCADSTGACTLRAAVQEANADGSPSTVVLASNVRYTLGLGGTGEDAAATGDLDVSSHLAVKGNWATIDGAGIDRIFDVAAGASLHLVQLTLTGGSAPATQSGGAVRNAGDTTITESTLSANTADTGAAASGGAILNAGELAVDRSTISDNSARRAGGGIEATAGSTTWLSSVLLSANSTGPEPGNGGGLHLTGAGTVSVDGSEVSGNSATAEGGGLWNSAAGTMTVNATSISANTADGAAADQGGGGLYNDGGDLTVDGSAVVANTAPGASGSGGGILNNGGTVKVTGTAVGGNTASRAGGGIEAVAGTTSLSFVYLTANKTGPMPGNGGGLHLTGAGEVDVSATTVVGNEAAAEGGGLWNSATGTMNVSGSLVTGNSAAGAAADQGGGGLFNDGGALTVDNTRVTDNHATGASGSGGGILNNMGALVVTSSEVNGNSAKRAGGGIEAVSGTTTLESMSLSGNSTGSAPGNGGGLHLTGAGVVDVTAATVADNLATAEGGGLWNSATGTMTVSGSDVSGNVAQGAPADQGGGGLFNDGGTLTVSGSAVTANMATGAAGSGGGIFNNTGDLTVVSTNVIGNTALRAGGGIEAVEGSTLVSYSTVSDNRTGAAPGNGGGVHLTGTGDVTVEFTLVEGNSAANEGGGLWNSATGTLTIKASAVQGNSAPTGPNVFSVGGPVIYLDENGQPV